MNDEKEFYEYFLDKKARITKKVQGRDFFYNGIVIAILNDKLVLNDKKTGRIIISFEAIINIEELKGGQDGNN